MKAPAILASLFGSILATSALAAEVSQPRHEVKRLTETGSHWRGRRPSRGFRTAIC